MRQRRYQNEKPVRGQQLSSVLLSLFLASGFLAGRFVSTSNDDTRQPVCIYERYDAVLSFTG